MASLFYPRFVVNEFAPVFRLLDDLQAVSRQSPQPGRCSRLENNLRSFQPRFDVKENKDSYELKGELPGIEQNNIEVAFTDEKTLKITGHTESRREEGTRPGESEKAPAQVTEGETTAVTAESDTASYHKASVEDEDFEHVNSESEGNNNSATATPSETPQTETAPAAETEKHEVAAAQPAQSERSRYWVSERSTGRFSRTFTFPSRINQEQVSASLKNGILSIVVPKAPAPENKRIAVQ